MSLKKIVSILFFIASTVPFHLSALAQPVITGASGGVNQGSSLTITGIGFGTKNPAKPLIWADFEAGLNPTNLGIKTAWDNVQSLDQSTDCPIGGCVKATDGSGIWTLGVDYNNWTADGQKSYIFKRQKLNFLINDESQNWKNWRMWPSGDGRVPNIYSATNIGRVYVEEMGVETGFWGNIRVETTSWITEEFIVKASTLNAKNGLLTIRYDGQDMASGTIMTRSSTTPDYMTRNYPVHGVVANTNLWTPGWNTNNRLWADDVYVDTTWSRVMVCETPIFLNCRKLAIQIPNAWSNNSITVTINRGGLSNSDFGYLYVFDSNGLVNAVGHRLCSDCPTPPTNLRVQ